MIEAVCLRVYLCREDSTQIRNHHSYHLSSPIGDIMVGKPYNKGYVIGGGLSNSRLVIVAYKIGLSFSPLLAYSFCLSSSLSCDC
jgi:hypothetical protein